MREKIKVLVVEDNNEVRRLYAIGLNQRGFEVKLAANGAEALDRIDDEDPDLVILDLMMPVMNGFELLEKLNPGEKRRTIPVIVVSGQIDAPTELPHPSIAAWLSKPVTIDELASSISRTMTELPSDITLAGRRI